jgi:Putative beta-barrel porin 2
MKKIVASVSLVAIGASSLQADLLPGLTSESGKPWTLSATLRGFYDDNINTIPNNEAVEHRSSYGVEVSPDLEFNFLMEQTTLSFGYIYSYKYYQYRLLNSGGNDANTHDFHAALTHAFSERYSLSVKDSFVIGQEPDFLRAGNTYTTFQRYSGNNMRNFGIIDFTAQLTPDFGLDVGYANTMLDYSDTAMSMNPDGTLNPSNAGLLNSLDNVVHLDGRYQLQPQTIGIVGVQFRETDYTGNQDIGVGQTYPNGQPIMSDARNARSYYGYLGLDQNFRPDLTGSIRAGARYSDYYNDPASQNEASPYAMASLKYTYLPESYLVIGGSYDYSPSSVGPYVDQSGQINVSAQSGTIFASVVHRIMPKLFGSIQGQYQNSTYVGGVINGQDANFYLVGLNLRYQFTRNFSAEAGYNYDDLQSNVMGSYDRNRVYVGITGSY